MGWQLFDEYLSLHWFAEVYSQEMSAGLANEEIRIELGQDSLPAIKWSSLM